MPQISRSAGYLGDLGKRLQRFFQFDGEAGASFKSEATPVLIIGDASKPGYGDSQLRSFVVYAELADNQGVFLAPLSDIIITRITAQRFTQGLATLDIPVHYYPQSVAANPSIGSVQSVFLDRAVAPNDQPPANAYLCNGSIVTAGAVPVGSYFMDFSPGAFTGQAQCLGAPFCLAQGTKLQVSVDGTDGARITIWGHTI